MEYNTCDPERGIVDHFYEIDSFRQLAEVKESLHNIVKYTGPCDVNLKVQYENGAFRLEVLDNGNGFDMQVVSRFKNGIKNMYNRATDISGTFEMNSSPGTGTSLILTVPLMELL